jgi:hypothetical protein
LWISNDSLELLTDSVRSISLGCGAFYAGHWVQYKWPTNWEHESFMRDIAFLELIPIVLAMFVSPQEYLMGQDLRWGLAT